jgi:hypothetical protein
MVVVRIWRGVSFLALLSAAILVISCAAAPAAAVGEIEE